jgi:1,4-alpha-glucan branching enzyme
MAKDNLALVIYASHAYLRNTAEATDFSAQNDILFSAISQTYLPLLDMLSRLEADGVNCRIGLVLPPTYVHCLMILRCKNSISIL